MSPILPEFIKGLTLKTKDFAVKSSSSKLWMPQDLFFLTKIHPISEKISEWIFFWEMSSIMIFLEGMYLIYKNWEFELASMFRYEDYHIKHAKLYGSTKN